MCCGIVGLIVKADPYKLSLKYRDIFKQMLFVDQLRGDDSTGIYSVNENGNVSWFKEQTTPNNFLLSKQVDKHIDKLGWSIKAMVGHNRSATRGVVSDENAHPFAEGTTILVHNGTIFNQKELNQEAVVDSHAICHAIEAYGIEDTINKINGAFALAIYKAKDKKLTLTRNKERPLWIGESEDAWFFASEPWLIQGIASRNGIKVENVEMLNIDRLYEFDLTEEKTATLSIKVLHKPKPVLIVKEKKVDVVPFKKRKPIAQKEASVAKLAISFKKGDTICFKPNVVRHTEFGKRIEATHYKYPQLEVWVHGLNEMSMEKALELNSFELLTSTITNVWYDSKINKCTLFVKGATVSEPIWSENGVELNEEQVSKLDTCTSCYRPLGEPDSIYYKECNNGKIIALCDECLASKRQNNPMWGISE